ncbi:hypothetical protein [Bacillus thuringiensis]|uniref:hypothetical protein n=1 Tax=Bacillus thuringiensis TaxID=1428 RepID=UPI000B15DF64|nr:hypothetical protein [Bacillus thuringiensis]
MKVLRDQLREWKSNQTKKKTKKKRKEKLSTRQIEDLMEGIGLVMNEDMEQ